MFLKKLGLTKSGGSVHKDTTTSTSKQSETLVDQITNTGSINVLVNNTNTNTSTPVEDKVPTPAKPSVVPSTLNLETSEDVEMPRTSIELIPIPDLQTFKQEFGSITDAVDIKHRFRKVDYQFEKTIGTGSYGKVKQAVHRVTGLKVSYS